MIKDSIAMDISYFLIQDNTVQCSRKSYYAIDMFIIF